MRKFAFVCVASALMLGLAAAASAGEKVSKSKLGSMGLGSMRAISNVEGTAVRGRFATASVSGTAHTQIFGSYTTTNYSATSTHLFSPAVAAGGAIATTSVGPFTATSAGGSFAFAL